MRCKFRLDVTCFKIQKDCLNCELNIYQRLENYSEKNKILNQVYLINRLKDNMFICPFCLYVDALEGFLYRSPKTLKIMKIKKCPDCNNYMFMQTLESVKLYSPEEFARFIVDFPYWEFWRKCNHKKFMERSKSMVDVGVFWDEYKNIKGRIKTGLYNRVQAI